MLPINLDAKFLIDPYPTYERLRSEGPVHCVRFPDGLIGWLIVDYDVACSALVDDRVRKDPTTLLSIMQQQRYGRRLLAPGDENQLFHHMLNYDPPEHTRLRRLISHAFKPKAIERLVPRIEEIVLGHLAEMDRRGPVVDLVTTFAQPVPMDVVCELLGIPESDRAAFRTLYLAVRESPTDAVAELALIDHLNDIVAYKRRRPGADLITDLIEAANHRAELTESQLIATIFLLLEAGHETVANLIATGTFALLTEKSDIGEMLVDPDRIAPAIEELLRWNSPLSVATYRFTAQPLVLHDTIIPVGELIWIGLAAANRDPRHFSQPDLPRMRPSSEKHLAFGYGAHYCLGAPLARTEGRIAFEKLISTYPTMRLAADHAAPNWRPGILFRSLDSLLISLN